MADAVAMGMKNLDDGPDGLNEAAFERMLGGGRKRAARRRPAPKVAPQPSESAKQALYAATDAQAVRS